MALLLLLLLQLIVCRAAAVAAIYRWDDGTLITEKDAEPGAQLGSMALSYADLADSQLSSADLSASDLSFGHLMRADLTGASLAATSLADADLTGAVIGQADLRYATRLGFTAEQFYSTASYQDDNLRGLDLGYNELRQWDFSGKDLTGTDFFFTVLNDADLRGEIGRAHV